MNHLLHHSSCRIAFVFFLCSVFLGLFVSMADAAPKETPPAPGEAQKVEKVEEKEASIPDEVKTISIQMHKEFVALEEKKNREAPWRKKWEESQFQLKKIQEDAEELAQDFDEKKELTHAVGEAERHFSQMLPSMNRYKNWAAFMEALMSRLHVIERDLRRDLAPLYQNHHKTLKLHESIASLSTYTSNIEFSRGHNVEYQQYQKNLQSVEKVISKIIDQQKMDLAGAERFFTEIATAQTEIQQNLPELWKTYYLQKPLAWLDQNAWKQFQNQGEILINNLEMRKTLEIPSDTNGWRKTILRIVIFVILFAVGLFFLRRQSWIPTDTNPIIDHIFTISLPIICLGLTLLIASLPSEGESYRVFRAIGNIFIILGQIYLAWDLRLLSAKHISQQKPPLLRLFPLTCIAYILIYLPLLPVALLLLWVLSVFGIIIWRRFWPDLDIGDLRFERNIRSVDGFILGICLILALCGLQIFSVILYLCFVSIMLATELCLGGIDRFNYLNENQPQEGIRAILSNIAVSLAAPIIMLIVVSSVLLWVATLPGGMTLMQEYLFKNVSIGSAEFNLIHILIIFSAFFLTKAIVASGSRYLSRFITSRNNNVDATLVTPAQTAFTYAIWIIFALFVMHILDIDLKNAAMVLTGLSVGIGMGLQSIVNNFFSGLLLIFGRMLQIGDVIEVKGITGHIEKISVRHTLLRTYDNAYIYIPNAEFINGHLINWSRHDATVRVNVSVGVAYGNDTALVVKLLKNIVARQENILRYPEPSVAFKEFGDNALEFAVFFWVRAFDDKVRTSTAVRLEIEREFAAHHIEIAYPQLDVHLKTEKSPRRLHANSALGRRPRMLGTSRKQRKAIAAPTA